MEIYVGVEQERFSLPMRLLAFRSSFFESYFIQADNPSRLDLPDDEPVTFAIIAQWMYQLPSLGAISASAASVYALYYMADRFFMKKLQDEVLKCIIDLYLITREGSPPFAPEAVSAIYRETKVGSPIRLFAVDALAYSFMNQGLDAVEMRPVFLEHPIMAADFIEAIRGICGAGEDYMTVRARHRRYNH